MAVQGGVELVTILAVNSTCRSEGREGVLERKARAGERGRARDAQTLTA